MEQINTDLVDMIKLAISEHKLMHINYNDSLRIVNPHVVGTDKNGDVCLRAVQSASTLPDEANTHAPVDHTLVWKLFNVEKIKSAGLILDTTSTIMEGYNHESDQVIVNPIAKV